MQVPLWLFVTSLLIAFASREMASLLLRRGGSSGGGFPTTGFTPKDIRAASSFFFQGRRSFTSPSTITSSPPTNTKRDIRPPHSLHHHPLPPHPTLNSKQYSTMANINAASFLELVKNRRTYYQLSASSPIPDSKITEIVSEALKHSPSSFNSQSTRVVVLLKEEHVKLWDIAKEALKAIGEFFLCVLFGVLFLALEKDVWVVNR